MTGLLITGGEKSSGKFLKKIIKDEWLVIAADSGFEWAVNMGIQVSICVGDMDSIIDETLLSDMNDEDVFRYPEKKDHTDTEIGIKMLKEKGCDKIIIWGAGGGRMDHFLAVYSIFEREDPPDEWYTDKEHMILIDGKFLKSGIADKRISLFPMGLEECRMKSRGLKWPLDKLVWNKGDFGISNIVTGNELEIEMKSGKLLMIYDLEEGNRP